MSETLSTEASHKRMSSVGYLMAPIHSFLFEMTAFGNVEMLWSQPCGREVALMFHVDILGLT